MGHYMNNDGDSTLTLSLPPPPPRPPSSGYALKTLC